jgi:hypothetical protein
MLVTILLAEKGKKKIMVKICVIILSITILSFSTYSADCEKLKIDLRKEKMIKIGDIGFFTISTCLAGYSMMLLTTIYDPPRNRQPGKQYGPTEKEKITWGVIGILACISYTIEIPVFIKSVRKSNRINEAIDTICNTGK